LLFGPEKKAPAISIAAVSIVFFIFIPFSFSV